MLPNPRCSHSLPGRFTGSCWAALGLACLAGYA
jgi:hypothetical protein